MAILNPQYLFLEADYENPTLNQLEYDFENTSENQMEKIMIVGDIPLKL